MGLLALQAAIANAATFAEVEQLEQALRSGQMPSQVVLFLNCDHLSVPT